MSRESISITPPLTPEEKTERYGNRDNLKFSDSSYSRSHVQISDEEFEEELHHESCSRVLWFNCKGKLQPKSVLGQDSYLGASALSNLLYVGNPFDTPDSDSAIAPEIIFENLSHFFFKIRKNIQALEQDSKPFCLPKTNHGNSKSSVELRKEVVDILSSLSHLIMELQSENDDKFLKSIVIEMIDLTKFLGPMYQLPQHVTSAISPLGNKCVSPPFHLFHLHLDVRWWTMSILYQLEEALVMNIWLSVGDNLQIKEYRIDSEVEDSSMKMPLDAYINLILWDIITLIERESTKSSISDLNFVPYFPCSCGYEVALFVLHLCDWRQRCKDKEGFWSLFNEKLLVLMKTPQVHTDSSSLQPLAHGLILPPPTLKNVKMHQIWWIFCALAKLFSYNANGQQSLAPLKAMQMEPQMLRTLISTSLSNCAPGMAPPEEAMRFYLQCCFMLRQLWQGVAEVKQIDWVIMLWDHFSRSLNSNFLQRGNNTLEGFANLSKTPSSLVNQVKSLSVNSAIRKSENSWNIFLRILACVVEQGEGEWRILKGRILSKFHCKRMTEMSPIALHNTILLFLTLANSTDTLCMCSKLCDLLCDIPPVTSKKLHIIALGLASSVYLLVSKHISLMFLADQLNAKIKDILQQSLAAPDVIEQREIGHSIVILCEGFQEVIASSADLTLGQNHLFCPSLNQVLLQGGPNEQKAILAFFNHALDKVLQGFQLHSPSGGGGFEIFDSIRTTFLSTIKTLLGSKTHPVVLVPICASLVLIAARFRPSSGGYSSVQEAESLFTHVIGSDFIDNRWTLQFLIKVLSGPDAAEVLPTFDHKYDEKIVSCLLTKLFELGSCEEVISASELVFATPAVSTLTPHPPACPFGAFGMLIQNMAKKFNASETFQVKAKIREKAFAYFGCLAKAGGRLLKKSPLLPDLPYVTSLIGCAFAHGSHLFYVKGEATCVLAALMSIVILPHSVYDKNKPLDPALAEALRPLLPKVVSGLVSLGFSSDPYISRCLKDVCASYAHRYPSTSHPFIAILTNQSVGNPSDLLRLFISTMTSHYIAKRGGNLLHIQRILSLLLEFVDKDEEKCLPLLTSVSLGHLMELLIYLEDLHTKRAATDLLQRILRGDEQSSESLRVQIVEEIRRFVASNVDWYFAQVFRILNVIAVTSRTIIVAALPDVAETLRRTEERRGSGLDQTLRKGYASLVNRLSPDDQKRFNNF